MTNSDPSSFETDTGVEYILQSMIHKAVVQVDPMNLEMLDGFETVDAGYKFTPQESNVRAMVTGRDWSEKRVLIYGGKSTEEAKQHVETIINRVTEVGHNAELTEGPEITNMAVGGDFGTPLKLESLSIELSDQGVDVEYEPEQFPAVIIKLDTVSVTFLLFSTGRFVIQGLRKFDDIEPAIAQVQHLLREVDHSE